MKLKYYLRGIGIGVILTALIMGFALGGRKSTISDAEVIERAKKLGMVQGGVLTDYSNEENSIDNKENSSSSATEISKEGKAISSENDEGLTLSSTPIPKVDTATSEKSSEDKMAFAASSQGKSEVNSDNSNKATDASKDSAKDTKADSKSDNPDSDSKEDNKEDSKSDTKAEDKKEDSKADDKEESKPAEESTKQETPKQENTSFATGEAKTITIPGGLSSDGVARLLYDQGLIDDAVSFNKYLVDNKKDRIIRSGVKNIPAGSGYEQIASIITK